jgi:hypothetical protein
MSEHATKVHPVPALILFLFGTFAVLTMGRPDSTHA